MAQHGGSEVDAKNGGGLALGTKHLREVREERMEGWWEGLFEKADSAASVAQVAVKIWV